MSSKITYDQKVTLTAPTGGVTSAIQVTVEVEPSDAGCLIYGWTPDRNLGYIEVTGSGDVELPFAHPEIYVKYLKGLQNIKLWTRGYTDSRGAFDPFPIPTESMPQKK